MPIDEVLKSQGILHYGFTPLQQALSFEIYEEWIAAGKHGEMAYLKEHLELKKNPQNIGQGLGKKLKSSIVITQDYYPHPKPIENFSSLRVAFYAQGEDYHHWFKEKLDAACAELKKTYPGEEFLSFTDSGPILERDLAQRAGLGWVGKNTCIIHPKKGSLFFIGEIFTSLNLQENNPAIPDFCGTCTRCIDICPTKAINKDKDLDARLCISYWTIESRKVAPVELRENFQDWFYGCDLCQSICPWNEKLFQFSKVSPSENKDELLADLRFLLTASGKQIEKKILGTPLKRAGPFGLRRNALVVVANKKIKELTPEVEKYISDERLGELAQWALTKLN